MHTREYNGFEIKFPGPDLYQDEILSEMNFLLQQIEEINSYPDKSLFFQNSKIVEGWLQLVNTINKIEVWEVPEDEIEWEDRTETYVAYLLTMRELYIRYQYLYRVYYEQLKKLLDEFPNWIKGVCFSGEEMKTLNEDKYREDFEDVEDVTKFLAELNVKSAKARADVFSVLTDIYQVLMVIMNRGETIVLDLNPYDTDFAKAIDDDLREWTFSFGESTLENMKEELTRHFKPYRTAPYTPELWGELLSADEDALLKASRHELAECDAIKQEHWGEDTKKQMDNNGELMRLIYMSCKTEKLFDIEKSDNLQRIVALLTPENLSLFYDIIVRRNLIQCEMYPKLKAQHNDWLNPPKIDKTEDHDMPPTHEDSEEGVKNENPVEEELFHFIHVEIGEEEAWHIHKAIKRLVANYSIPEICNYLKEQKQKGKLMLPSDSSAMYNELVRLGMPTGKGFSVKNFSNIYQK